MHYGPIKKKRPMFQSSIAAVMCKKKLNQRQITMQHDRLNPTFQWILIRFLALA